MNLVIEIERFLDRTGTSPSKFGWMVVNDRGFVSRLRSGRVIPRETTVQRVLAEMRKNPDGWPSKARGRPAVWQAPVRHGPMLDREPCPRCAVRGELGCRHRKPFAAVGVLVP